MPEQQSQTQKKRTRFPWIRAIAMLLVSSSLSAAAILLILSIRHVVADYWLVVIPVIFTVIGQLIPLGQWLFPIAPDTPNDPPRSPSPAEPATQNEQTKQPTNIWNVPYRRNPFFTGREELLKHLHDNLTSRKAAALTQALSGLGGIGKTQTAVEYAYRYRDEYHDVLWVNAATRDMLIASFLDLAHRLNLPEKDEQDQNITVQAIKRWLEQHDQWLLIFDNADDLALAEDFLPTGSKGHILLTTRTQAPGTLANGIDVEKMDTEEGMLLLLHRTAVLRMVEDYATVFGGRDAELTALSAFLAQEFQSCALLLAPTGRGKTALLIHWLAQVQAEGQWTVIFAPISRRYQTATAQQTLGMLAQALAAFHGGQLQSYNMSPDQLRSVIADYLRRDPPIGKRLLLLFDGLDETIGWSVSRDLFPRTISPHLRIVASARELAQKTRDDWLAELGWTTQQTAELSLPLLSRTAIADILRQVGSPLDTLATDVNVLDEILRVSQGDPLTIRFLVEGLQDGTETVGRMHRRIPGLEAYVRDWLEELRQRSVQIDAVYTLLGLCAVAHGPLTNDDLQALAPRSGEVAGVAWTAC